MSDTQSPSWRSAPNWRSAASSPRGAPDASARPAWRDAANSPRPSRRGPNGGGKEAGGGGDDAAASEGRRIYVGNLLYSTRAEDVEQMVAEQGLAAGLEKVHISLDPFSGRNPGYCFVEFADRATADRALEALQGVGLNDRPVRVGPCQPKKGRPAGGEEGAGTPERREQRWGERRGENGAAGYARRDGDNDAAAPREGGGGVAEEKRRLYVGGLPKIETQEECEQEMRGLFGQFAIEAISKPIPPHPSTQGKPGNHYYCFVDFATAEDAAAALAAQDGQPFRDGSLRVGVAKGESRRPREPREQREPRAAFSGWDRFRNPAPAAAEEGGN